MIFLARVIDNSTFVSNGTIKVILPQQQYYVGNSERQKDATPINKQLTEVSNLREIAVNAKIMSYCCSGDNSGMVQIPQINSTGYVFYDIDENKNDFYLWLGGTCGENDYRGFLEGQQIEYTLPNDDTEEKIDLDAEDVSLKKTFEDSSNTKIYSNEEYDGSKVQNSKYLQEGKFIIKTKTCTINNKDASGTFNYENYKNAKLDYTNIPSENTFSLDKSHAALRHCYNNEDDGTRETISEINLGADDSITIERDSKGSNNNGYNNQTITISSEGFVITTTKDDDTNIKLTLDNNGNITLENKGEIEIKSEGDINVSTNNKMNLASVGEMTLNSEGKMSFVANGRSLKELLDKFAHYVEILTTFGSESKQAADTSTYRNIEEFKQELEIGYF